MQIIFHSLLYLQAKKRKHDSGNDVTGKTNLSNLFIQDRKLDFIEGNLYGSSKILSNQTHW